MPTVEWNRKTWGDEHGWAEEGDEWAGMAKACGQPYDAWKHALIDALVLPYVDTEADALEIAPGHGRWSATLVATCRSVTLVDLNPECIATCRRRFADRPNVTYHVNDGRTLPNDDGAVDFVWSFDSFVHMDLDVIAGYLGEIARVLRPGGIAVLHHANKRDFPPSLRATSGRLGAAGLAVQRLATQGRVRDTGNRSDVSARLVADAADAADLKVLLQVDRWGPGGRFTVGKYRDAITVVGPPDRRQ